MRKQAIFATFFGGDKRDRTADLLNAIQALSRMNLSRTSVKPLIRVDVFRVEQHQQRTVGRLESIDNT